MSAMNFVNSSMGVIYQKKWPAPRSSRFSFSCTEVDYPLAAESEELILA